MKMIVYSVEYRYILNNRILRINYENKYTRMIINAIYLGMSLHNGKDEFYITFDQSYLQHLLFVNDLLFFICFFIVIKT